MLTFSTVFLLCSCSWRKIPSMFINAWRLASPNGEDINAITLLKRQDLHISSIDRVSFFSRLEFPICFCTYSSMIQFSLQVGGSLTIMHTLSSVDYPNYPEVISTFPLQSLIISCFSSFLTLSVSQYAALNIQFPNSLSFSQRMFYMLSCILNSLSMLTISTLLVTIILIISSSFTCHYHLMVLLVLGFLVLITSILVTALQSLTGLNQSQVDRVIFRIRFEIFLAENSPLSNMLAVLTMIGENIFW